MKRVRTYACMTTVLLAISGVSADEVPVKVERSRLGRSVQ